MEETDNKQLNKRTVEFTKCCREQNGGVTYTYSCTSEQGDKVTNKGLYITVKILLEPCNA